ncbi:cytochrome P450 4C1-like [Anopheles maculipalpis]|uniref:cytochrome P450 4C1-like n=1 Tax=Anopheles maculipalpis TaxID=1496333 RepID=UPI0021591653|nr:cytochrome P450 4C1-like [Anopheles maculipalpis]
MAADWSVLAINGSPLSAVLLLPVLLLLVWIVWDVIDRRGATYGAVRQFPGPPVWPLIGTMYSTRGLDAATTFDAFRRWTKQYDGTYRLWLNSYLFSLNITRCQQLEPFMSGGRNTDKSLLYRFLHPFIGIGLLNSAGAKWLQRRRILTPTFHFHILNGFHRTFCEESEKLAAKIDSRRTLEESAVEIDLQSAMSQLTLNTICETSMGVKLDSLDGAREYRDGIYKVGNMMLNRAVRPWLYVDWVYRVLGYTQKLQRLLKPLHLFTNRIIAQRRELFEQGKLNDLSTVDTTEQDDDSPLYGASSGGKKRYAMLDTLLAAETQGLIDADGIREEVETFTFEGHDTTASALVFIFLTLSWEPEIQDRLYQELVQLYTEKKGTITHDDHLSPVDLSSLKFFDRVIKECLRLWPPVAFISRSVTEEISLPDGRTIPKRCIANLHIFDLHRDPAQFPDPERFDPDRFLPDRIAARNPFAYVPFSAGQRNCIGQKYALLEVKTVVAYLVLRYRILPVTRREEIRFIADLVLRASSPLKVCFERRRSAW